MNRQRPRSCPLRAGARPGSVLCGQARPPAHGAVRRPRSQRRLGARGPTAPGFPFVPAADHGGPDRPQEAILKVGFSDGIYGRSKGGLTSSGWKCEHLPYLVEIDNWGVSQQPGKAKAGGIWVWGYDEITWFAHQSKQYRADWLHYAWDWVRKTDPNGYLQMPGSRTVRSPLDNAAGTLPIHRARQSLRGLVMRRRLKPFGRPRRQGSWPKNRSWRAALPAPEPDLTRHRLSDPVA